MQTFVMMTKLSPDALKAPALAGQLNRVVEDRIRQECPGVRWLANYAVLGSCDYLDIFECPDSETATKIAVIVRSLGHATTETWLATPWDRFLEVTAGLKGLVLESGWPTESKSSELA